MVVKYITINWVKIKSALNCAEIYIHLYYIHITCILHTYITYILHVYYIHVYYKRVTNYLINALYRNRIRKETSLYVIVCIMFCLCFSNLCFPWNSYNVREVSITFFLADRHQNVDLVKQNESCSLNIRILKIFLPE